MAVIILSKIYLICLLVIRTIFAADSECVIGCNCKFSKRDTKVTCSGKNITEVPNNLPANTTKLYLSGTGIKELHVNALSPYPHLTELFFRDTAWQPCQLERIEAGVFDGLHHLEALGMVGCERLETIGKGVLGAFQNLETLQIFRCGLKSVPDLSAFSTVNPDMNGLMKEIDFHNNKIEVIRSRTFWGVKTDTLKLEENKINAIEEAAFQNATIVNLRLNMNSRLTNLHERAFEGVTILEKLDLSNTRITSLPTIGLGKIKELVLKQTPSMKHFPSVLEFTKIEKAELYYPHHCCAFKNPEKQDPEAWRTKQAQERINRQCAQTTPIASTPAPPQFGKPVSAPGTVAETTVKMATIKHNNWREKRSPMEGFNDFAENISEPEFHGKPLFGGFREDDGFAIKGPKTAEGKRIILFHGSTVPVDENITQNVLCGTIYIYNRNILCTPEPDAFNPCEDVMGYFWLRVTVWFVLLAALLGNSVVFLVLITSRSKFTVPKFLMCNLAFADFFMGVYLLLLASIDVHTLGEYFNYAVQWQNEGGCQAAGFLSVFSSELSIFTLTIITLERWYAISHAIHLNKRLKLRQSLFLMFMGFLFASALAVLPLAGISGYGNVSICLPMKAENAVDVGYIVSLLIMNGVMFLAICFCYINMYWKVKSGSDCTARSNDATIAKRMALLVFTNFACWAPIAFFGLTASAGLPLIDITNSKILLVFFYPLNSCANPFLYAILTKQFRKDVFIFLGRYGICVDKANMYRGTHTTRSMSHSKGGKDMILHSIAHPNETLFSQLMDSNHSSKHSVNSTPKVHPKSSPHALDVIQSTFIEKNHLQRAADFANKDQNLTADDSSPSEIKSQGALVKRENKKDCPPPYIRVRSVSDYMTVNKSGCGNGYRSAPHQQVSVETYVSGSTDTTYLSESSHGNIEDIWQIREDVDESDLHADHEPDQCLQALLKSQQNPFNCMDCPSSEEKRISQKNCFIPFQDPDFDDDENAFKQLLLNEVRSAIQVKPSVDSSKVSTKMMLNSKYKFARSPSLSSLEETVEHNIVNFRHSSSSSYGKDLDTLQNDMALKGDKSKESGFHSSSSLRDELYS